MTTNTEGEGQTPHIVQPGDMDFAEGRPIQPDSLQNGQTNAGASSDQPKEKGLKNARENMCYLSNSTFSFFENVYLTPEDAFRRINASPVPDLHKIARVLPYTLTLTKDISRDGVYKIHIGTISASDLVWLLREKYGEDIKHTGLLQIIGIDTTQWSHPKGADTINKRILIETVAGVFDEFTPIKRLYNQFWHVIAAPHLALYAIPVSQREFLAGAMRSRHLASTTQERTDTFTRALELEHLIAYGKSVDQVGRVGEHFIAYQGIWKK